MLRAKALSSSFTSLFFILAISLELNVVWKAHQKYRTKRMMLKPEKLMVFFWSFWFYFDLSTPSYLLRSLDAALMNSIRRRKMRPKIPRPLMPIEAATSSFFPLLEAASSLSSKFTNSYSVMMKLSKMKGMIKNKRLKTKKKTSNFCAPKSHLWITNASISLEYSFFPVFLLARAYWD